MEERTTARVTDLEQKVTQLAQVVESQAASSSQDMLQLQQQVLAVEAKIPDTSTLEARFESIMTKFCGATDKRLQQMEQAHSSAFTELKALLPFSEAPA